MVTQTTFNYKPESIYSFDEYLQLMENLVAGNDTSGDEKSSKKIEATSLNLRRLKRLSTTSALPSSLAASIQKLSGSYSWYVLMESWCGDGAQTLPILRRIERLSDGKIKLKIVLRDENPELMDQFLTNGSRSIPKLIWVRDEDNMIMEVWGPRTKVITQLVRQYKTDHPEADHDDLVYNLQLWYTRDRGESLLVEMENMIGSVND